MKRIRETLPSLGMRRRGQRGRSATAMAVYLALAGCVCAGAVAANLMKPAGHASPRAALAAGSASQRAGAATAGRSLPGGRTTAQGAKLGGPTSAHLNASVTTLPGSGVATEPSLAIDSQGTIFVTGPSQIGHSATASSSPLWKSTDGGATWTGPINTETTTNGQMVPSLGGGDSDIVIGPGDTVYVASLWLGNTSMSVSKDHGQTFTQLPIGHVTPVDDRPWLYYDPTSSALYMDWDGAGALHVGKALLGAQAAGQSVPGEGPEGQLVFEQDVAAVPNEPDRGCPTCPPGSILVDASGNVDVAFAGPSGVGVASSSNGLTSWTENFVPGTANASSLSNDFQVLRADSQGNLYLLWTQTASNNDTQVFLSYLRQGATTWHAPVLVSTSKDALFGTLAVVSPGTVDVAYYGTSYSGVPDNAPASTSWDLYLAQVQNLFGGPSTTTADVLPGMHHGSICTQGVNCQPPPVGSGANRRLGDFFSMTVDSAGLANIITAVDDGSGVKLQFVHEDPPPPPPPTPGPAFVLPTPAAMANGSPAYPYPVPSFNYPTAVPTPAPEAASPAPADTGSTAQGPSGDTGTTGRTSGPKYPDGVGLSSPDASAGGGAPGHGLPLWAYGLAGVGATFGRFILRRGRG